MSELIHIKLFAKHNFIFNIYLVYTSITVNKRT